jgi:hypothetical protein
MEMSAAYWIALKLRAASTPAQLTVDEVLCPSGYNHPDSLGAHLVNSRLEGLEQ